MCKRNSRELSKANLSTLSYSFWLGTFLVKGSVASRVFLDVLVFGTISLIIVLFHHWLKSTYDSELAVPVGPFEAAGAVLGLLLVLRVNAGYNRWWEARKLWGGIVNQTRNLAISGLSYGPCNGKWQSDFIRWVAALPHVIRRSLRDEKDFPELKRLLPDKDLEWLSNTQHMPVAVASVVADQLQNARNKDLLGSSKLLDGFAFIRAEQERSKIIDYVGGCERIRKTPLPRSGAIQVRQFVFLYVVSTPFAMLNRFEEGWTGLFNLPNGTTSPLVSIVLVPLFVMLLAYFLLSLDRIGMELQDPFDPRRIDFLPLDEICTAIEKNVLELLHNTEQRIKSMPALTDVELPPDAREQTSQDNLPADIS